MLRTFARCSLAVVVTVLAAGPLLAGPLPRASGPTLTAPAGPAHTALRALGAVLGLALPVIGITIRKDTATLAKKFVTRATAAAPDYKDGVSQAGGEWEQNTKNSEANYEQGVNQAIADKRFGKGVSGSAGKYQANATTLGSQRYGPGVQNAQDAWTRGVQPALDVLKALTLPPKGPKRSPQNQARANAVAVALGAMKVGR